MFALVAAQASAQKTGGLSKWGKLRKVSSAPGALAAIARPPQHTPRWKGQGLAGILDSACKASDKQQRRRFRAATSDVTRTPTNLSARSSATTTTNFGDDSQVSGPRGKKQLSKKLERQCEIQTRKLLHLESDAEANILESTELQKRVQELKKQDKEEHHLCHEYAAKSKKAEKQLKLLLNAHANVKLDMHLNQQGWQRNVEKQSNEIKQLIRSASVPDSNPVEPQAREAACNLVTTVQKLRRANEVKPQASIKVEELRKRCNSAAAEFVPLGVREKALKETIARTSISASILERDLSCQTSSLNAMQQAASKEASQFEQYGREKAMLEQDLEEGQRKEEANYQQAEQIKINALNAYKEAREKQYLGELEVRKLENVLRETKDKTAEHVAEAELLAQWETRLPATHLQQYKIADDQYYKLAEKHHDLNKKLREVLDRRKAESDAARGGTRDKVVAAW